MTNRLHSTAAISLPWKEQVASLCVYVHALDDVVIYVGICPIVDVFRCPDARDNTEWCKLINASSVVTTYIKVTGDTERDLYAERSALIRQYKPFCNFHGVSLKGRRSFIVCDQDTLRYPSQTAACKHYDISLSAMSAHLAGKPGHKTVKGRTFHRED